MRRFSRGSNFVAGRRRLSRTYLRVAVLIGPYPYRIRGGLSARREEWGIFGDYLGGC